ncbi:MAG TPA: metallophosphoesterase [Gemmatimonadaceae bacterium]|nr:metallophosphoesterase [Gemmatimonadaceae bacterium]
MTNDGDRARWFGRAKRLTTRKKLAEIFWDTVYVGGWPSRLARPLGLQGRFGVAEHRFALPGRAAGRPPLRVAFASDFHASPATAPSLVADACRALADARPDLLLLGGDFVSFHARHVDALARRLAAIEAPLGKLAVLGNHDLVGDDAYIVRRLAEAGVRTLVNANVRLPAPHDDVWVCGLDDPTQGHPDADAAFGGIDGAAGGAGAGGVRLLLVHSPDGLATAGARLWAVGFCGHVHGGQFLLPGGRILVTHKTPYSKRYVRGGVVEVPAPGGGTRPLLVSRGIGQGNLPLRHGADPQVHVVTLG